MDEILIVPFTEFVNGQKKEEREVYKKWRDAEASYYDNVGKLENISRVYAKAYKEFESAVEATDKAILKSKGKQKATQKLSQKLYLYYTKFKDEEVNYTKIFYKTRDTRTTHIKQLKGFLDSYQKFAEDQIELLKNKFTLHYDKVIGRAQAIYKLAEEMQTSLHNNVDRVMEVEQIVRANESDRKNLDQINFARVKIKYEALFKKLEDVSFKKESLSDLDIPALKLADPDEMVVKAAAQPLKLVLSSCWTAAEVAPEKVEEFRSIVATPQGRKEFYEVLNHYRAQGLFTLSESAYKRVGDLLMDVLDEIEKADDIDAAFTILILAQTYYHEPVHKKGEKLYLQSRLQKHSIWSRDSFWEKAVEAGLKESIDPVIPKESKEDREQRIHNSVFSKLGSIAQNMMQLGIDIDIVKRIVITSTEHAKLPDKLVQDLNVVCLEIVGEHCDLQGKFEERGAVGKSRCTDCSLQKKHKSKYWANARREMCRRRMISSWRYRRTCCVKSLRESLTQRMPKRKSRFRLTILGVKRKKETVP
eukprot:TRINITY_DN10514_c0_g1_i12.p1 TRINITY_DN10514_c0_g1~~TRINITY_DN10514_c0_g1_i12.p1  ORF type:complete len:532 (-),score=92.64 TRINITY_DN10514_c0_g1_i12:3704-5299(-)